MSNRSVVVAASALGGCVAGVFLGFAIVSRSLSAKRIQKVLAKKQRGSQSQPHTRKHTQKRKLGRSGVEITVLGQGGASLGDLYVKIDNSTAMQTLKAANDCDIGFYDTSPYYGVGLSEARFGVGLHHFQRSSFVLQTKVGRYLVPDHAANNGLDSGWIGGFHMRIQFDYSAAALFRQYENSLQRMGLGYIDSLVIHDLEPTPHIIEGKTNGVSEARAHLEVFRESGFAQLQAMRRSGLIKVFGAGLNSNEKGENQDTKRAWNKEYLAALIKMGEESSEGRGVDFLLLANMWSLLNFEAMEEGILDLCLEKGISVVVGGPFSSGILATGADPSNGSVPFYNYTPASDEVRARCRRVESICKDYGVPLIAAALQFPLLHPAVACVIPGGKSASEVRSNVDNMNVDIPAEFWNELREKDLIPKF